MVMSKALYVKMFIIALVIIANLGKRIQICNNKESVKIFVHLLKRNIIKTDKRHRIIFNVMRNIHDTLLNKKQPI